ncbi:glutamyl aminopeptidase-like [Venturia canescens]|uniref:glutamyl aminopeptidase-like n=1 Tax=Venturia canescens TaxID=32260 RepID=UPI001C9D038E|nr:glutamyl aminopeptidase-like [Venturia canescens]
MAKPISKLNNSKVNALVTIIFLIAYLRVFEPTVCLEDLDFRLTHDVVPIKYVLQLHPNFETEQFSGEVTITIQTFTKKRFIAVHAKDLSIRSVRLLRLKLSNGTSEVSGQVDLKNLFVVEKFDMLVIETAFNISAGYYRLRFEFGGIMSRNNKGFLMRNVSDSYSSRTRKLAMTHFEPTYARYVFPCFDEPEFKTVFDISVIQPNSENYCSLSNMPVQHLARGVPLPELTTVYFKQSWPTSTHLIALIVTDFVNQTIFLAKRWETFDVIPLTIWTSNPNNLYLDLALYITHKSMDLYMRLFRLNYPLEKIDIVIIRGFVPGSTENWGLVFLEEPSAVYFARANSVIDVKIVTNRISNGLVRMWFGNLVTLNWWSDYWLRDSFATYMQYFVTNWIFPEWKQTSHFIVEAKYPSMERDALISSLPMVHSVNSSLEIRQYVNSIFSGKGASIIRMLYHVIGDPFFFHGIANFLRVFRYNIAGSKDFFLSLQRYYSGEESLIQLVGTWTEQPGFPVLNIERMNHNYYITQSRFLWNNRTVLDPLDSPYSHKWDLPIFYTTNINSGAKLIFVPHTTRKGKSSGRLRMIVMKISCAVHMEESVTHVSNAFRSWMENPNCRPFPDIKDLIYNYGMAYAGEKLEWEIVRELFSTEPDYQERHRLMISLTAIQRPEILLSYLEDSKDLKVMNNEEYLMVLRAAALNSLDSTVWSFYKKNWHFLASRYSEDDNEFARLIIPITSRFRDSNLYGEASGIRSIFWQPLCHEKFNYLFVTLDRQVREFFKNHPCGELRANAREEALAIIRNNVLWMEEKYNHFKGWFETRLGN